MVDTSSVRVSGDSERDYTMLGLGKLSFAGISGDNGLDRGMVRYFGSSLRCTGMLRTCSQIKYSRTSFGCFDVHLEWVEDFA